MSSLLDKLNLRPGERRLVVLVAITVFVVLNIWLVWPSFGEWGRTEKGILDARKKLRSYDQEVQRGPGYEKQRKELQNQGLYIGTEDGVAALQNEVISQAALSGVTLVRQNPITRTGGTGRTNTFFDEASMDITVNAGEKELVDFLYSLGARNSLIRVGMMNLGRDATGTKLQGGITLVESFQKKPPPKLAPITPAAATASVAKTTNAAAKSTNAAPPKTAAAAPPKTAPSVTVTNPLVRGTNLLKRTFPSSTVKKP
jgi:hypothetical protein